MEISRFFLSAVVEVLSHRRKVANRITTPYCFPRNFFPWELVFWRNLPSPHFDSSSVYSQTKLVLCDADETLSSCSLNRFRVPIIDGNAFLLRKSSLFWNWTEVFETEPAFQKSLPSVFTVKFNLYFCLIYQQIRVSSLNHVQNFWGKKTFLRRKE